jgi:hypothetical protein
MALKLNTPVLQDNPLFIAETRPQKIEQLIAGLGENNLEALALHLHEELETLNRQRISPSLRLQALETYRPFLINASQLLAETFIHSTLPLQDKAKSSAAICESLWLELGYGYKLALIDLQNQLIKLGTDKSSALAIHHAIHAISEYALVHYQTYVIPPSHIWSDLHQLYFCAVQLGIHNSDIESDTNNLDDALLTTIENAYKHALLMSLAEPQQLTQHDIRLIDEYLIHHIKHTFINAVMPLENTTGAFIISLDSDSPPVPFSKLKNAPNPVSDVLLQTIDLLFAMHQDLKTLQNHQLPKNNSIPAGANRNNYIELLTHLIKNWGISPKRIFNRSLKNGDIELVTGISALHRICNHTNNPATAETTSHWKILNISPTGMAIRRHHTAEKNISVGTLIGIKTNSEARWDVGFVRWANCGTRDRLDIGVQLIAADAVSAIAHAEGSTENEQILLLPEIVAAKQAATIIAPIGTYKPARQLSISYNNNTMQVMLTKLVEHTHLIERIQYSILA